MKCYLVAMVLLAAGLAGAAAFYFWPAGLDPVAPSPSQPTGEALLARGEYLTKAADCVACHTAPGGRPFAGGRAFEAAVRHDLCAKHRIYRRCNCDFYRCR